MSYTTTEAALLTTIQLLSTYNNSNSSKGDARILANGKRENIILNPGEITIREVAQSPRRMREVYLIQIELIIRWKSEISEIWTQIRTVRQELLDHLDKYPTLNGAAGVVMATVERASEPVAGRGDVGQFWSQTFSVRIEERKTVTIAE